MAVVPYKKKNSPPLTLLQHCCLMSPVITTLSNFILASDEHLKLPVSGHVFYLFKKVLPHLFPRTAQLMTKMQSNCVAHTDSHAQVYVLCLSFFSSKENSMGLVETRSPKPHTFYPEVRLQNNTFPTRGLTGDHSR